MVTIENVAQKGDIYKCNLYFLTMKNSMEILDNAGLDYEACWSGVPMMKAVELNEAVEIISGIMEDITSAVKKIDKKLGDNRKKMEENLQKTEKKAAAEKPAEKPATKPAAAKPAPAAAKQEAKLAAKTAAKPAVKGKK